MLTGGEAHDFPLAKRLIRRVKPPEHLLGDMAYDGDELREELESHRTKSVIPNRPNRRHPFSFSKRLYKLRWRIESAFNRLKDFRRIATRYDKLGRKLPRICLPCRSPCMVDLMSQNPKVAHQALEAFLQDVRVDLRGRDVGVAEQLLHDAMMRARSAGDGWRTMAQHVWPHPLGGDSGGDGEIRGPGRKPAGSDDRPRWVTGRDAARRDGCGPPGTLPGQRTAARFVGQGTIRSWPPCPGR